MGRVRSGTGLQAVKEGVCGRVDFDALCVDVGELGLPPVDDDGAVCVVGGVGGGEDVGGGVWAGAEVLVEFGADGEASGGVGHGSACGWARHDGVEGYASGAEGKVVYRPRERNV